MSGVPAWFLRALAEAADGHRTDSDIWIVGDTTNQDHLDALEVYTSESEAQTAAEVLGSPWAVYGPYQTAFRQSANPTCNIVRVVIVRRDADGNEISTTVTPEQVEAIFLTSTAIDRFLIPFYTRIRGVEYAAQLREDHLSGDKCACCKGPKSLLYDLDDVASAG